MKIIKEILWGFFFALICFWIIFVTSASVNSINLQEWKNSLILSQFNYEKGACTTADFRNNRSITFLTTKQVYYEDSDAIK